MNQKNQIPFVITGIQSWDITIGSNCKDMALELSKTRKVLYVNPPLDRASYLKNYRSTVVKRQMQVIKKLRRPFRVINENLTVFDPPIMIESIQWMPHFLFNVFNQWASETLGDAIIKALQELQISTYNLFIDSDMFRSQHLIEKLKPTQAIYYTRDNLMTVPYWQKHGKYMEPNLMRKADLVVSNSPHLRDIAKQHNKNSHFIGQGCDVSSFIGSDFKYPEELSQMNGPVIGYVGLLSTRRLDLDILAGIALARPEWNIVLVGPEEECFAKSQLHQLANVHFLGKKNPEELPHLIKAFDVCINPQTQNELTKGNYPRKIDEYLAAGKPIVATNTPTMAIFDEVCWLAQDVKEYVESIEEALKEDSKQKQSKRIETALSHTWENCINLLFQTLTNQHQPQKV